MQVDLSQSTAKVAAEASSPELQEARMRPSCITNEDVRSVLLAPLHTSELSKWTSLLEQKTIAKELNTVFVPTTVVRAEAEAAFKAAFPEYSGDTFEGAVIKYVGMCNRARFLLKSWGMEEHLIDFYEFYAGAGLLSQAALDKGLNVRLFDVAYSPKHDVLEPEGLRTWLEALVFSKVRASEWLGITCTSWVWICRATAGRTVLNLSLIHISEPTRPY